MTSGSDMATAKRKIPTHMTVDEFLAWVGGNGRYQLVDGEVRAMSPACPTHARIQTRLARFLDAHLDVPGNPCNAMTEPGIEVRINARTNVRVPDIAASCVADAAGQTTLPDPILLIEIMSPGNARKTWENVWAYTTIPTVMEIVVIQSALIEAEIFRRQGDGAWPKTSEKINADDSLRLATVTYEVPLRALYASTHLAKS